MEEASEDVDLAAVAVAVVRREAEAEDSVIAVEEDAAEAEEAVAAPEVDAVASVPALKLSLFRTIASRASIFSKERMTRSLLRTSTPENPFTTRSV